jgi:acetolactate decarboxylase
MMVEYRGAQRDLFRTGQATPALHLHELARSNDLQALGPCAQLDGEITIIDGEAHISRVRDGACVIQHALKEDAIFLVWAYQARWHEVEIPDDIHGYLPLQAFIREAAREHAIDTGEPFPFRIHGTPVELAWHVNVDRTGGKPITEALFRASKQSFTLRNEPAEIVGFYSEHHEGVFISAHAPAVDRSRGERNAMHLHFVSGSRGSSGHIDDLRFDGGMRLGLPA